jgi:hypothetical protein
MIRWVPFSLINQRHLEAVAKSLLAAPADIRLEVEDLVLGLKNGYYRMFEWDKGLIIVHRFENRLVIDALTFSIFQRRQLATVLQKLAADWLCDKVQTTAFDKRVADAIVGIGGKVESYDLVLEVGTG